MTDSSHGQRANTLPSLVSEIEARLKEITPGEWQDGIAGRCDVVSFDGEDVRPVAAMGDGPDKRLVIAAPRLLRAAFTQLTASAAREQALLDFMESCQCGECYGSGRTSNHVTGEVECSSCEGTGHDSWKAFELVRASAEREARLRALVAEWRSTSDPEEDDGICCAECHRHDADDLENVLNFKSGETGHTDHA